MIWMLIGACVCAGWFFAWCLCRAAARGDQLAEEERKRRQ